MKLANWQLPWLFQFGITKINIGQMLMGKSHDTGSYIKPTGHNERNLESIH